MLIFTLLNELGQSYLCGAFHSVHFFIWVLLSFESIKIKDAIRKAYRVSNLLVEVVNGVFKIIKRCLFPDMLVSDVIILESFFISCHVD